MLAEVLVLLAGGGEWGEARVGWCLRAEVSILPGGEGGRQGGGSWLKSPSCQWGRTTGGTTRAVKTPSTMNAPLHVFQARGGAEGVVRGGRESGPGFRGVGFMVLGLQGCRWEVWARGGSGFRGVGFMVLGLQGCGWEVWARGGSGFRGVGFRVLGLQGCRWEVWARGGSGFRSVGFRGVGLQGCGWEGMGQRGVRVQGGGGRYGPEGGGGQECSHCHPPPLTLT